MGIALRDEGDLLGEHGVIGRLRLAYIAKSHSYFEWGDEISVERKTSKGCGANERSTAAAAHFAQICVRTL